MKNDKMNNLKYVLLTVLAIMGVLVMYFNKDKIASKNDIINYKVNSVIIK